MIPASDGLTRAFADLAAAFREAGDLEGAAAFEKRSAEGAGDQAVLEGLREAGMELLERGRLRAAAACFALMLGRERGQAAACRGLSRVFEALERLPEAARYLEQALACEPDEPASLLRLGILYERLHDRSRALAALEQYVALQPSDHAAFNRLAHLYGALDPARCIESHRRSLRAKPTFARGVHELMLAHLSDPDASQAAIRDATVTAVESFLRSAAVTEAERLPRRRPPRGGRRIHVGYLSGDFHRHVLMYFIEPVLRHHDRERFKISCYAHLRKSDEKTSVCRACSDSFRDISMIPDRAAARMIREDEVDILVDLSGHTAFSRLFVLAYRPAPIQASYCGYPNTTGLREVDYLLTDEATVPSGKEDWLVERTCRLRGGYECYKVQDQDLIDVPPLPASGGAGVTFGYFNDLAKLNRELVGLYADVLRRVPASRLYFQRDTRLMRRAVLEAFAGRGLGPDRLAFEEDPPAQARARAACFGKADIALDAHPYNGTATTIDSILMGVPVVCIRGEAPHARSSARINRRLGLDRLVADDPRCLADIAGRLAQDMDGLARLRRDQRPMFLRSPLVDAQGFTRGLEDAYRGMWSGWTGKPAPRPGWGSAVLARLRRLGTRS